MTFDTNSYITYRVQNHCHVKCTQYALMFVNSGVKVDMNVVMVTERQSVPTRDERGGECGGVQ